MRPRSQQRTSGGVTREDSDSELGEDDHPWEWVYSTNSSDSRIIGAKMGDFSCKIGDCVLLKAEANHEAWVGIICEFLEGEEEKMAHFMWFSTEKEIRNKLKKRTDFMPNELYITPSWDFNPLASINGKAYVMSPETFRAKYPSGKIPRSSKYHGKTFVCRRGCNTRTASYTDEFKWEDIYQGTEEDIQVLVDLVRAETKQTRKPGKKTKRPRDEDDDFSEPGDDDFVEPGDDDFVEPEDDPEALLETPRKRRKTSATSTPRKQRTTPSKQRTPSKLLTPSNKRFSIKKPLEFTPLGTRLLSPSHVQSSPFQIARSRLHVAAVPSSLPCREAEFAEVHSHLEAAISDGSGACIYISGTPGTGKTATVREVVAQLNASVAAEELDDFIFVEINGMKVTDPHQSYSLLWEALKGDRVSPSHALNLLEREFGHPSPRRIPCVVLMDELDQLVTKNQSVMYNFFNWPGLNHSRLIVLAVANTMDLPERTLSNKISSRLGLTRITFPGYNHEQLMKIIQSRLEGVPGGIVDADAVQFASRKVAAVSGDARRALDICRRAVELAEAESQNDFPATPSKSVKKARHAGRDTAPRAKVTIAMIKRAISEATSSPLQQCLKYLPLSSKLLIAAILARTRRSGLVDSIFGEVVEEAKRISKMAHNPRIVDFMLTRGGEIAARGRSPSKQRLDAPRILSMGTAAIDLVDAGIIGLEARKGDRTGKVRLLISEQDVKLALKDDPDMRDLGFSV